MVKKLNSMRVLEAQGVRYEVLSFPDTIQAAVGVAAYYGLSPAQVYKTLVVVLSQGKPALVLIAGDREIQLKQLARALGEKRLRMATQKEAEAWTGLKVGGISALALLYRGFPSTLIALQPLWTRLSSVPGSAVWTSASLFLTLYV